MISAPIIPTCGHLAMGSQTSAASTAVVVSCCIRGLLISVSLCRLTGIADPKKNHFWYFWNKVVKPIINHPPSHSNHYKWILKWWVYYWICHTIEICSFQATETGGRFCVAIRCCECLCVMDEKLWNFFPPMARFNWKNLGKMVINHQT